jgi:hypothetical protein
MDFSKLRTGELVTGIAGVLLLIDMFLPWYGIGGAIGQFASAAGVDVDANAWDAFGFIDLVIFVTSLVAIGSVVLAASGRSVALPVAASVVVTVLAIVTALLILYRIINPPGPNDVVDVQIGAWLGLLLTVGVAGGGFLSMSDEGTSLGDAARGLQGGGGTDRPAPPAAPPPPPPPAPPSGSDPGPPPSAPPPGGPPPQV